MPDRRAGPQLLRDQRSVPGRSAPLLPAALHGGDGRLRYADVEAVRVGGVELTGHRGDARGGLAPLPLPARHHRGAPRLRRATSSCGGWPRRGARPATRRDAGIDVRAVTAWSLLGSFGWDRLVVEDDGNYEPGLFDLRAPAPRPTALAHAVRALGARRGLTTARRSTARVGGGGPSGSRTRPRSRATRWISPTTAGRRAPGRRRDAGDHRRGRDAGAGARAGGAGARAARGPAHPAATWTSPTDARRTRSSARCSRGR